jgi:hypothetical protein
MCPTIRTEVSVKELEPTIDQNPCQNRKAHAAAIVYDITIYRNSLPFGIAIADIEQSEPHLHKVTIETYTVVLVVRRSHAERGRTHIMQGRDKERWNPRSPSKISPPNMAGGREHQHLRQFFVLRFLTKGLPSDIQLQ